MAFHNLANNATGKLASGISDSDTTINLGSGEGAKFPSSDFYVTLYGSDPDAGCEIAEISSRTGDALTVLSRGVLGTSASAWPADSVCTNAPCDGYITEIQAALDALWDGSTLDLDAAPSIIDFSGGGNSKITTPGNLYLDIDDDNNASNYLQIRGNGSTNVVRVYDSGGVNIQTGYLGIGLAAAPTRALEMEFDGGGGPVTAWVKNTGTASGDNARFYMQVPNGGPGDPFLVMSEAGGNSWVQGLDVSDGSWQVCDTAGSPGTNPRFRLDTSSGQARLASSLMVGDISNNAVGTLDVNGGCVIGSGWAGATAPETDGLAVENCIEISAVTTGSGDSFLLIGAYSSEPTAPGVNKILMYSKDDSVDAEDTLAFRLEKSPESSAPGTITHRLPIWINGVEYYIGLDPV